MQIRRLLVTPNRGETPLAPVRPFRGCHLVIHRHRLAEPLIPLDFDTIKHEVWDRGSWPPHDPRNTGIVGRAVMPQPLVDGPIHPDDLTENRGDRGDQSLRTRM